MNELLKRWELIFAAVGLVFYGGAWYQRSGSTADVAVVQAQVVLMQGELNGLLENEKAHDRDITRLIDSQQAQQTELQRLERGKH